MAQPPADNPVLAQLRLSLLRTRAQVEAYRRRRDRELNEEAEDRGWDADVVYEAEGVLAACRVAKAGLPTLEEIRLVGAAMAGTGRLPPFAYPDD